MNFELNNIICQSDYLDEIKKDQLKTGDQVVLKTHNSIYTIKVDIDGTYLVSGGWFDYNNLSPLRITIKGCTWGGSVIKTDIIAARNLFLEFGNNLVTSRIKKIFIFHNYNQN